MLQAHGLAYGFRGRAVGGGVDIALKAGEALCILGPNGAGKTTLMRTLLGLLPPLAGRVRIDGADLPTLDRAAISRRVAYVPQASPAVFEFGVMDIVLMARMAHIGAFGRPGERDRRIAREALEHLDIGGLAERSFGAVSGGERQLVLIARALAAQAGCIVLDEPTAQLDYGNQARVVDELARLRDQGIAILLSTHDPDQAFRLADHALLLARGGALAQGPAREVLTAANLSRLYDVQVVIGEVATPAGSKRVSVAAGPRAEEGKAWR